ncbi:nuclear transport factor 2 family protein [Parafrankia sp. FMc6]|uniref:nuclear transport factor 2 family protein n=1 Tax=Parafrankia soli TaxID=2599596 RepID=UPI0034D694A3
MSEIEELRATVEALAARVALLEDKAEIIQLVAQYGPAVDSGSADAAADLWTEDGIFDAVPHLRMRGRDDIVAMVNGGHQRLIQGGCGHVLTVPHIVVDGDEATGRSYALNIRWDAEADPSVSVSGETLARCGLATGGVIGDPRVHGARAAGEPVVAAA